MEYLLIVGAISLVSLIVAGVLLKKPPCSHEWKVIDKITSTSQMELLDKLGLNIPTPSTQSIMNEMCKRKHSTLLSCKHCGKLKTHKMES